jgi:phenylpropionate dioxygenase-like ring-hydroxylating dioxygenase large terminal subunit
MIRDQWYAVLDAREVKGKPVGVTRMGEKLVFWRDSRGGVHCAHDRCVHRGARLSQGKIRGDHLECPFHGFLYDASGRVTQIPANGRGMPVPERFAVTSYQAHEAHGFIFIYWGEGEPAPAEPRFFEDLDDGFVYATAPDPWDAHYSRVIENQLDVVHLPFVHHNTIGRGGRELVDGPGILWVDDGRMQVFVYNRVPDGTPPRRIDEVPAPDPTRDYRLELIMPNLWQNRIGEDVRVVAAFAPVDDEHTILYLRFYQRFLPVPILGRALARLAMPFNRIVAHQDRRIVNYQQPKASGLRTDEQLIQGDRPIVEYRRRREALQRAAGQVTVPISGEEVSE